MGVVAYAREENVLLLTTCDCFELNSEFQILAAGASTACTPSARERRRSRAGIARHSRPTLAGAEVFHWPPKGRARRSFSLGTILQLNINRQ